MKIFIYITSVTIFLILTFSCNNNNPVNPVDEQPGRRDYVWTVDTINYPNSISRIWGSSPTDVWAGGPAGDVYKTVWHFDGKTWSTDNIFRTFYPESFFGFAANDVYMGSGGGKIFHFDGNEWELLAQLTKDGHKDIIFTNMWGTRISFFGHLAIYDLYAVGAYGDEKGYLNKSVIAHLGSNGWEMLSTNGLKGLVAKLYEDESKNIFVQTIEMGAGEHYDSTLIYEYSDGRYTKLYSSVWDRGTQADISLINGEVYFILGNEIAQRKNNQFQTYLTINNSNFFQRIWGRNSQDIFLSMIDGLAHYNGTDLEYLFKYNKPSTYIFETVIFKKEVFCLVIDYVNNLNLIYHGKLK